MIPSSRRYGLNRGLAFQPYLLIKLALQIEAKGGLKAIVISHPHYYTTYAHWAKAFHCPIYVSADDQEWFCRRPPKGSMKYIEGPAGTTQEIVTGVTAVKLGGHFPGSLILHWEKAICIADTLVTVPVGIDIHGSCNTI